VVVATIRALKMHGGVAKSELGAEDLGALERGFENLARHVANLRGFGLPVVVAVNHFGADTEAEHALLRDLCAARLDVEAVTCRHWAEGGVGAEELAHRVAALCEGPVPDLAFAYPDEMPLAAKVHAVATRLYGAADVAIDPKAARRLAEFEAAGFSRLPVCMAKTQYSFSTDPTRMGAPTGHVVPVREVRLCAGAGFVVAVCGDIMTMPGLPRKPAAEDIRLDEAGNVEGLF
jgi:formate--tetrahydrofolate ligase